MLRSLPFIAAMLLASMVSAQEICDNGIDDDGNGLIDLNDTTGCPCTLAPPRPNMLPNPSFEDHTCCPPRPLSGMDCVTGWTNQTTYGSASYFNACSHLPATIPQPMPDGQGVAGFMPFTDMSNWNPNSYYGFLSACLTIPMNAGQPYEMKFNVAATNAKVFRLIPMGTDPPQLEFPCPMNDLVPINLTLFGYASCPTLPYTNPQYGQTLCPTYWGWTELGHVTYNPVNAWQEVTFNFVAPFDVQAIMFGPPCPIPQGYWAHNDCSPFIYMDDMALKPLSLDIEHTGHPCTHDLQLTAIPYDPANSRYQWYLDGVAIVGQTGEHLLASTLGLGQGIYTVRSIATNGDCLLASDTLLVKYPKPLLSATPQRGCAPLAVTLSNSTDPALTAHLAWDLGDGTTDTNAVVAHTYRTAGTYSVRLSVTSPEGCMKDSLFQDLITVHPRPVAAFSADTTSGCVGLVVQFSNATTSPDAFTSAWDFGDGTSSTDQDPQHTYTVPGNYDVRLTVTSAFGCSDDTLRTQFIAILATPEPAFAAEPDSGCIPLAVRFNNQTPGQELQDPEWDLGNGQTSTDGSPSTTYTIPGHYTVTLTMRNALGCSATITRVDAVAAHPIPVVTFSVAPDSGCAPLTVRFTNSTDPGMIGSCHWDFGDGGSAPVCDTTHTYATAGDYNVTLVVTSPAGCAGDTTLFDIVHVDSSPMADFSYSPRPADINHPYVLFRDRSSNDVTSWLWDLPSANPNSANTTSFRASYPDHAPGEYPVTLIVSNGYGCTDTTVQVVTINGVLSMYVPNAFSPDGDGVNDLFLPVLREVLPTGYSLLIFDRWGEEVFSSSDPTKGWDGSVKGAPPKNDVYAWKIRARSSTDLISREYNGHVTLVR
ncbi:MAG: PKD domain-containing protein [Flavobacteriales bacterium]